jgi:hypothetical protein
VTITNAVGLTNPFGSPAPACVDVTGDVSLSGQLGSTASLAPIRSIGGNLTLTGGLDDAAGFTNLTVVDGDLIVFGTNQLVDLELPALTDVGGVLRLGGNTNPQANNTLAGISLPALIHVGGTLTLERNSVLTLDVDGAPTNNFAALTTVDGDFNIVDNDLLCEEDAVLLFAQVTTAGAEAQSGNFDCVP